jgi:hypothetical protein
MKIDLDWNYDFFTNKSKIKHAAPIQIALSATLKVAK